MPLLSHSRANHGAIFEKLFLHIGSSTLAILMSFTLIIECFQLLERLSFFQMEHMWWNLLLEMLLKINMWKEFNSFCLNRSKYSWQIKPPSHLIRGLFYFRNKVINCFVIGIECWTIHIMKLLLVGQVLNLWRTLECSLLFRRNWFGCCSQPSSFVTS